MLFTIGHSTHPIEEFTAMLHSHGIKQLIDVRTVPRSRYNPQFNLDVLPGSLARAGIGFAHLPELGGLRHARKDSPNAAWKNESFRGYADYMQTPGFEDAIGELLALAREQRTAMMCAESVPWRCHRSLIADALSVRGVGVEHILSSTARKPHSLTSFARVEGTRVTYPLPLLAQGRE
jgi:uncharacterized protein (DUF488 family)